MNKIKVIKLKESLILNLPTLERGETYRVDPEDYEEIEVDAEEYRKMKSNNSSESKLVNNQNETGLK